MDLEELRELIAIFEESDIEELDIEKEGIRVRLKKSSSEDKVQAQTVVVPTPAILSGTGIGQGPLVSGAEAPLTEKEKEEDNITEITSPMVGTFYRAPAPEAEPFVEEGQVVEPDQTLCIIEAMKIMNELKAEFRCRIKEILVENGQPVEYGQPLFLVEKLE